MTWIVFVNNANIDFTFFYLLSIDNLEITHLDCIKKICIQNIDTLRQKRVKKLDRIEKNLALLLLSIKVLIVERPRLPDHISFFFGSNKNKKLWKQAHKNQIWFLKFFFGNITRILIQKNAVKRTYNDSKIFIQLY